MGVRNEVDAAFVRAALHARRGARRVVTSADLVAVVGSQEPVSESLWDLLRSSTVEISPQLFTAFGRAAARAHEAGASLRVQDIERELEAPAPNDDESDRYVTEYVLVSSRLADSQLRDWDRVDDLSWALAGFLWRARLDRSGVTDLELADQLVGAAERVVATNGDASIPASLFAQACGQAATAVGLV